MMFAGLPLFAKEGSVWKDNSFGVGSTVSRRPSVILKVDPEYTKEACEANLEGTVSFQVMIREDGFVEIVKKVQWLGLGLDEKAALALRKWNIRPQTKEGKPAEVPAYIEMNFKIIGDVCNRWK